MSKPIVHYMPTKFDVIKLNTGALIHPLDHPSDRVSNKEFVVTSKVIAIDDFGFETQNTIYRKQK